jgi:hypothetical protein
MPHAIIRAKNGRRHEVDFGDSPVRVEISASDETVEILIETDFETHPEERGRFALLNIPRHLLAKPPQQRRDGPHEPRPASSARRVMSAPWASPWLPVREIRGTQPNGEF